MYISSPQRACTVTVAVLGMCVSVSWMHIFSDTVILHIERKVPTASARHGVEYYKKGFRNRHFLQKLWHHFAYHDILQRYFSDILHTLQWQSLLRVLKKTKCYLEHDSMYGSEFFFVFCVNVFHILPIIRNDVSIVHAISMIHSRAHYTCRVFITSVLFILHCYWASGASQPSHSVAVILYMYMYIYYIYIYIYACI